VTYDPERHRRRSIRLKDYDYTQAGAYFVTICTQDRTCLFGEVVDGCMGLNGAGQMLAAMWNGIPARLPGVEIDAFVVMPNHLHGIILLADAVGAPLVGAHAHAAVNRATTRVAPTDISRLGDVVGAFKSLATVEYVRGVKTTRWPAFRVRLWQRNYYEHIIRNEQSLNRIRQYIDENPLRWAFDDENPQRATS